MSSDRTAGPEEERTAHGRSEVERVRKFFDRESQRYVDQRYGTAEPSVSRPYLERRAIVLDFLEAAEGAVLDIGCGPGVLLPALLDRFAAVEAIDVSPEMVERAKGSIAGRPDASRATVRVGSADALPFGDRSFDWITCIGVLSYWPDVDAALREIARVLRPGGSLILQASNIAAPREIEDRLLKMPYQRVVTRLTGKDVRDTGDLTLRAYYPPRLDARLARAGLVPADRRSYDFQVPLLRFVARGLAQRAASALLPLGTMPALRLLGTGYVVRAERR